MKERLLVLFLILLSVVPLVDMLHSGLPQTHDGQDHVARIANFYKNLSVGVLIPRWAGDLNWGYGHPILMFLYPLPSYLASLFHFLGFTFVDSLKLVFAVSYIASGLAMYLWIRSFLSKQAAFAAAGAYLFVSYRFVDLYVRGAIGEHLAFVFPPLICYIMLTLTKIHSRFSVLLGALSVCGLLLSHNAISLMFFPLFFLYAVYLFREASDKRSFVKRVSFVFLFGFALASFFWIPAFFEGKYTLRDIVTKYEYVSRFESFSRFLLSPWNYGGTGLFSVQVGFIQWFSIAALPVVSYLLKKQKNSLWLLSSSLFIIFCIVLYLMTQYSLPVWQSVTILQKFQFPWRLLSLVVFVTAVAIGVMISIVKKRALTIVSFCLVFGLVALTISYWHAKAYSLKPESFYTGIYEGTTDTGESSPIWSIRFMEKKPKNPVEIISGNATILDFRKTITSRKYTVIATDSTRMLENTLYFPGWEVYVNSQKIPLEFQDPRFRGLMTYYVAPGVNSVLVVFTETKLRKVANTISIISFVILGVYALYLSKKPWQRSQ